MPPLITKEQCNNLLEYPDINPITNRKINKKALNGLYKKLLKDCNDLYATKKIIQKSTMDSLKFTLKRMEDINSRIHNQKVIRKYISMISPCIVHSSVTSHILSLVKKHKGRFEDLIYFNSRIGSESAYGIAYLTTGVGEGSKLVFSAKIMSDETTMEIELLEKMSRAVQSQLIPNFPIIYKTLHCKEGSKNKYDSFDNDNIKDIMKKKRYYVVLNELATGDISHLLEHVKHTNIEYESILIQALISLRAFHIHTGYIHHDVHFGNFLYHKVKAGGYWHYRYNNTDIYVPNVGYLIVLWDPGLAKKITHGSNHNPQSDFVGFYTVLKGYIDDKIINVPEHIYIQIRGIIKDVFDKAQDYNAIMKYFEKKPTFQYILYKEPKESFIINSKPYYL